MIIAEFSMFPIGKDTSLSKYVAGSLELIKQSGLDYEFTAMGTIVEGQWDQVMDLIKRCHDKMQPNADRIYTSIKIDSKKNASKGRIIQKVKSVQEKL